MAKKPQAHINVRLNERPAVAGLKRLNAAFGKLNVGTGAAVGSVAKLGAGLAASAAGFALLSLRAAASVAELDRLSKASGETAENIDAYGAAAELAGAQSDDFNDALLEIQQRAVNNAADFKRWSIATKDVNGNLLGGQQILDNVSNKLASVQSQTVRVALADELLSDAGRRLLPFLQQGADAMAKQAKEARDLGLAIDALEADAGGRLADRFRTIGRQAGTISKIFGSVLAPAALAIADRMSEAATATARYLRANRALLQSGIIASFQWIAETGIPAVLAGVAAIAKVGTVVIVSIQSARRAFLEFSQFLNRKIAGELIGIGQALANIPGFRGLAKSLRDAGQAMREAAGTVTPEIAKIDQAINETIASQELLERSFESFALSGSMGVQGLIRDIFAYQRALEQVEETPTPDGPGRAPEDQKQAPIQRRTGNLLAGFFEERQRALDLQLADLETLDQRQQETAANFTANWQNSSSAVAGALSNIGNAISALGGNAAGAVAAQKAFAVAAIAINTAVAVSRALAELGPIAGPIAAASLIAGGAASVAAVIATQPGGTNALRGGGGTVRTGGGARTAGGGPTFAESAPAATVVNVNFNAPQGNPRRTAREINRLAFAGG